jgi:primosomal protein N'
MLIPDISTAQTVVANTELDFGTAMVVSTSGLAPNLYEYVATVDTWIKQATGAVAAAVGGAGSMFVAAKTCKVIDPLKGVNLSVIKDTAAAAGTAALVKLRPVR